jgi:hypothetical protein
MSDIIDTGLNIANSVTGTKTLQRITATNIGGYAIYCLLIDAGNFTLGSGTTVGDRSTFTNTGPILITATTASSVVNVTVQNVNITSPNGSSRPEMSNNALGITPNGDITLNTVTLENVSNCNGIRLSGRQGVIRITNLVIRNFTGNSGLGLDAQGASLLVMSDSTFQNLPNRAIFARIASFDISNTRFIDCTKNYDTAPISFSRSPIFVSVVPETLDGKGIFRNCTFEHTSALFNHTPVSTSYYNSFIGIGESGVATTVTFDGCTFTNLRTNNTASTAENYIFGNRTSSSAVIDYQMNLTIKNSTFTFSNGTKMGLVALYASNTLNNILLMDNVRITNNGSTQPIIWLQRVNTSNSFMFWPNNYYNGTLLNAARITNLGNTVIRLSPSNAITMIP